MVCRTRQLCGAMDQKRRSGISAWTTRSTQLGQVRARIAAAEARGEARRPARSRSSPSRRPSMPTTIRPVHRGRAARLRREPGAGSARQMAGAEGGISRHRTASDRPAAIQQGEGSGGAVRRDRDGRPREDRRRARQGDRAGRARRQGSMCRSTPARSRRRPASSRARRWPSSSAAATCTGSPIEGLMCIPPADENPGPHFALLEKLAREAGVDKLSMGMSGDYELAVALRRDQRPGRLGDLRQPLEPAVKSSRRPPAASLRAEGLIRKSAWQTHVGRQEIKECPDAAGRCPPWPT